MEVCLVKGHWAAVVTAGKNLPAFADNRGSVIESLGYLISL
jgi:hypothetical protein